MKTENIKIKLKVDLTRYNPILVKGIEGVTLPRTPSIPDCDTDCRFNGVTIRVANGGYEIIDEEYLAEYAELKAKRLREYLSATSVVKRFGPRGGFRGLNITFKDSNGYNMSRNIRNREEAEEIEKYLRDAGKTIEVKTEP